MGETGEGNLEDISWGESFRMSLKSRAEVDVVLQVRDGGALGEGSGVDGDGQRKKSWQERAKAWM